MRHFLGRSILMAIPAVLIFAGPATADTFRFGEKQYEDGYVLGSDSLLPVSSPAVGRVRCGFTAADAKGMRQGDRAGSRPDGGRVRGPAAVLCCLHRVTTAFQAIHAGGRAPFRSRRGACHRPPWFSLARHA